MFGMRHTQRPELPLPSITLGDDEHGTFIVAAIESEQPDDREQLLKHAHRSEQACTIDKDFLEKKVVSKHRGMLTDGLMCDTPSQLI